MKKIKVKKIKNVECYDFESKVDIPFNIPIEVEKTLFVENKLEEGTLEKTEETEEIEAGRATEILEEVVATKEGGGKDDNSKGRKSKKES